MDGVSEYSGDLRQTEVIGGVVHRARCGVFALIVRHETVSDVLREVAPPEKPVRFDRFIRIFQQITPRFGEVEAADPLDRRVGIDRVDMGAGHAAAVTGTAPARKPAAFAGGVKPAGEDFSVSRRVEQRVRSSASI